MLFHDQLPAHIMWTGYPLKRGVRLGLKVVLVPCSAIGHSQNYRELEIHFFIPGHGVMKAESGMTLELEAFGIDGTRRDLAGELDQVGKFIRGFEARFDGARNVDIRLVFSDSRIEPMRWMFRPVQGLNRVMVFAEDVPLRDGQPWWTDRPLFEGGQQPAAA